NPIWGILMMHSFACYQNQSYPLPDPVTERLISCRLSTTDITAHIGYWTSTIPECESPLKVNKRKNLDSPSLILSVTITCHQYCPPSWPPCYEYKAVTLFDSGT
ncbi:hypothetical protein, partial, partial [Absidia glauca]